MSRREVERAWAQHLEVDGCEDIECAACAAFEREVYA